MKEKIIFPFWMAFYSLSNFLAKATIKKSRHNKKKINVEYSSLVFQIIFRFEPILAKMMS